MHMLLSKPWRHRLLALHAAAGAGLLGAGVALLAWSGGGLASGSQAITVLAAHLALAAVVLGAVAFRRHWRRGSGEVSAGSPARSRNGSPS